LSDMYEEKNEIARIIENNSILMACMSRDAQQLVEKFCEPYLNLAERNLSAFRSEGQFQDINTLVADLRTRFPHKPIEIRPIIEQQVGSYHQEGKTVEAIEYLKAYYEQIKDLPDSTLAIWCHQRMAKFEFYMDHFEEALEHLLAAYALKPREESGLISDLISVYVELGKDAEAEKIFKQLTHSKHMTELTRSKYLLTCGTRLDRNYNLVLKICRARPQRKEGEKELDESDYERKLENFFLEVTFPHPQTNEPIIVEQSVDHYDIEIQSPNFTTPAVPNTWHLVKLVLYKDATKQEVVGRHWQAVCAKQPTTHRRY